METDEELAARLASEAGEILLALRAGFDGDEKSLAKGGDRASHEYLMRELAASRPSDTVVSEEGDRDSTPGPRPTRQWIVDPLDGTREYSERRSDFAVHVALVTGGIATIGAVSLPGEGLLFSTASPALLPERRDRPPRMLVSRTRPPQAARAVAEKLGAELVPMGSAGAKTMAVLRGIGDIYLHAGGQYEWDSAAPVAVASSFGAHVSRIDGSPVVYDSLDFWLPDLLVCRPEMTADVLDAVAAVETA
jgi:3'(2'), 5'-bisphosphate nucleotidase